MVHVKSPPGMQHAITTEAVACAGKGLRAHAGPSLMGAQKPGEPQKGMGDGRARKDQMEDGRVPASWVPRTVGHLHAHTGQVPFSAFSSDQQPETQTVAIICARH